MKKYLILLMMSVLFACNSQAGYVLKGVFKGAGNGRAVLSVNGVNQQMHSPTKFAAFCTEDSKVSPRTASAARMDAKMSPVPGREAPAIGLATVV